jgi:hypothetical protein
MPGKERVCRFAVMISAAALRLPRRSSFDGSPGAGFFQIPREMVCLRLRAIADESCAKGLASLGAPADSHWALGVTYEMNVSMEVSSGLDHDAAL